MPKPRINVTATIPPAANTTLFRRTSFWKRYSRLGGRATIGSLFRIALHIHRQAVGGFVTPRAVFLQRLHHNPVQVALQQRNQFRRLGVTMRAGRRQFRPVQRRQHGRGPLRLVFPQRAAHSVEAGLHQFLLCRTASGPSAVRKAKRRANKCRCACPRPARSSPPARDSCKPACR